MERFMALLHLADHLVKVLFTASIQVGTNFTVLHQFSGFTDGAYPWGGMIQASDGLMYGSTQPEAVVVAVPFSDSTWMDLDLPLSRILIWKRMVRE
jgi:hypothetical protein